MTATTTVQTKFLIDNNNTIVHPLPHLVTSPHQQVI